MPDALRTFQEAWKRSTSAPLRFLSAGFAEAPASDSDADLLACVLSGRGVSGSRRLEAYRLQYWYRLFTLMQEEHPLAGVVVGWEGFNPLVSRFLLDSPPRRNLTELSCGFNVWLRSVGADPQLVEACRVDAAWSRCFHSRSLPLPNQEDLHALAQGTRDLILQPSVQILRIDRDWLGLRSSLSENPASPIPPLAPAVWVLSRQGAVLSWESVDPRLAKLLDAMRRGSGWRETLERAAARSPDIVPRIAGWFAQGSIRQWWAVRT